MSVRRVCVVERRGAARDGRLAAADGRVPSPCTSVCRIDPSTRLCIGCARTLDEIARWGGLDDDARRAVWTLIDARRAQGGPR
jgi:predicted Fe-S protein YdhL (DUF1289 family)